MADNEIRSAFEGQARACMALGSPFTARLCQLFAARLMPGAPVADHLLGWVGDPTPKADSVPLRIAGCLHALVLERRSDALAGVYPPHEASDDAVWDAVSEAMRDHADFLLERLQSAPQTNEVRRSGALLPGFLDISRLFGLPLVLSELGASAGLNLQWDRYRYRLGEMDWGDPHSRVKIEPEWRGAPPPTATVRVARRAGCDLNPIDSVEPEQRLRMLSYIWADQQDRLERTRAALDMAAQGRVKIERSDAVDWMRGRLSHSYAGAVHVLFNTIAWQYLPKHLQTEGENLMATAGARATASTPLAWLQLESDGRADGAALTLQIWPSGEKQDIGRADFHGRWVDWKGWT
jgi:hypothetical protein